MSVKTRVRRGMYVPALPIGFSSRDLTSPSLGGNLRAHLRLNIIYMYASQVPGSACHRASVELGHNADFPT